MGTKSRWLFAPLAETRNKKAPRFLKHKRRSNSCPSMANRRSGYSYWCRNCYGDNPQLTARWVEGNQPARIIFDPKGRLPKTLKIFDSTAPTHQLTHAQLGLQSTTSPKAFLKAAMDYLVSRRISICSN